MPFSPGKYQEKNTNAYLEELEIMTLQDLVFKGRRPGAKASDLLKAIEEQGLELMVETGDGEYTSLLALEGHYILLDKDADVVIDDGE